MWAWTRYGRVRDKYEQCLIDGIWSQANLYLPKSPKKVDRYLALIEGEIARPHN